MCLCASLWFWFTYLSSVSGSACICNNMGHYRESYNKKKKKRSKMRSGSPGLADYASARLPITLIIDGVWKARPGRWTFLPRMKTHLLYVVMTYTTWPAHISSTRLSYEHASKSLSPLLLIWIYLLLWQWWDGWRNCLQWLLCSPLRMTRTMMMTADALLPGRRPGWQDLWPAGAHPRHKNALSLGRSFSLSLLYWSHSSRVHNFRVPGASADRREI